MSHAFGHSSQGRVWRDPRELELRIHRNAGVQDAARGADENHRQVQGVGTSCSAQFPLEKRQAWSRLDRVVADEHLSIAHGQTNPCTGRSERRQI